MPRARTSIVVVTVVIACLVVVRLALPSMVKSYVNNSLHAMKAYQGSVDDIDIHLWRGGYRIVGLRIVKIGGNQPLPFFSSEKLDLFVEWRSLFHGSVVAEAEFIKPKLNLVQSDQEQKSQLGNEENWFDKLKDLVPMRFNSVRVTDGEATFRVPGIRAQDALEARQVNGEISNLTNVIDNNKEAFSDFAITGRVLNNAPLTIAGSVNPFAPEPTFDVNLKLEGVQLPEVNPWLREFIKADAESGQFGLYLEMAAADGEFKGYAKPVMQNVRIARTDEDKHSPLHKLWEGIVDIAFKLFENRRQDQVAARVPFSGSVDNPKAGLFQTFVSVLRNAFVGAFSHSLEGSISLHDVKKNLKTMTGDDEGAKEADKRTDPQAKISE